jgi:CRP/FNR family transcriptional regulator, cyclic AMP receptor protein
MAPKKVRPFDAQAFLESAGLGKRTATYAPRDILFSQGDPCDSVMYVRSGGIQLSVLSHTGKEAIVAMLAQGDFLGEGALAGLEVRLETATATVASTVLILPKQKMIDLLHSEHAFSDRFIAHMLVRNARLEADLVDQLFNSSEKRLARTLLLLARYGNGDKPLQVLPRVSQEALAEMIGTTRSRVNFFLNKFRKLGFIEYDAGGLTIKSSLLTVVVHD